MLDSTRLPFRPRRAALLLFLLLPLAAVPASAQCPSSTPLTSNSPVTSVSNPSFFSLTGNPGRWSAVGVRSIGADWNLDARDATAAFPTCYSPSMASSSEPAGIDFLVTDWRWRVPQTDHVIALGAGGTADVEFEQTFYELQQNRPYDQVFLTANDVLHVREVDLQAGHKVWFEVWPSAGLSGLKFYLFAPSTSGTGWQPRNAALMEQGLVDGMGNGLSYMPSVSGHYGIVITNENGLAGDFYFVSKECPVSAPVMNDNQPFVTVFLDEWPGFTPTAHGWSVVGERGEFPGMFYNLDVALGFRDQNGLNLICSDSVAASMPSGLTTKVIAGDFRTLPLRFYTGHVSIEGQPKTLAWDYFEWEDGQDWIAVNGPPYYVVPPEHNVFDAWNVHLTAGGTYHFNVDPDDGGTAHYRVLLFANPAPGTEYWATRDEAVLESEAPGIYTAPATDDYGLVIVNDNTGNGNYAVSVTSDLVGTVPAPAPAQNRIATLAPNPSLAGTHISYELARAGRANLRVTDVSGREIARLALPARAGANTVAWDGRRESGGRAAPGVYFVTLWLDERAEDVGKLVVLR